MLEIEAIATMSCIVVVVRARASVRRRWIFGGGAGDL